MIPPTPGKLSSEFRRTQRAEVVGVAVLLVGVAFAVFGALMQRYIPSAVGFGLASVGAYVLVHSTAAYAQARGSVKAAAALRPAGSVPSAQRGL